MDTLTLEEISRQLEHFIKSTIVDGSTEVYADTPFNKLGIDSMAIIELVLFIERKFKISIPESELVPSSFQSINTLAQCAYRNKK